MCPKTESFWTFSAFWVKVRLGKQCAKLLWASEPRGFLCPDWLIAENSYWLLSSLPPYNTTLHKRAHSRTSSGSAKALLQNPFKFRLEEHGLKRTKSSYNMFLLSKTLTIRILIINYKILIFLMKINTNCWLVWQYSLFFNIDNMRYKPILICSGKLTWP